MGKLKKFFGKINFILFRSIGFMLYPKSKCGKEKRYESMHEYYNDPNNKP